MAYSKAVFAALKKAGASEGDIVRVKSGAMDYSGTLVPNTAGSPDCIVVKLPSGYHASFKCRDCSVERLAAKAQQPAQAAKALKKRLDLPEVSMIATGGTISARVDYTLGGVKPALSPQEIFEAAPELEGLVNFRKMHSPFRIFSENMSPREWGAIAKEVAKELNAGADGAIVMHGTDTLAYTGAALSFMLGGLQKPVALVGAMKSPDRGSFDGTLNLLGAANYAGRSDIAEVAVVMHASADDSYCNAIRATKARKMHSSRRDAFRPVNDIPLARVWPDGRIEKLQECRPRGGGKVVARTGFEQQTAILKAYPGSPPELLDYLASKKYRGIVIEGTGLGHAPMRPLERKLSWEEPIKRAVDAGVVVAVATQCLYGTANAFVYETARLMKSLGAVYCADMLPEVAYVKLGWLLGQEKDPQKVAVGMTQNIAGELNPRLSEKSFLV